MISLHAFLTAVSRLRRAARGGEKVHAVYLFLTPQNQLCAVADPYCRHGETRERARKRAWIEYALIDLDCSSLAVPVCIGEAGDIFRRVSAEFRAGRAQEERASNTSYQLSDAYQRDITALSDKLEGGAISQAEYWTLYDELQARYQRAAEDNAVLLPCDRHSFDIELVGNNVEYCYNAQLTDQLDLYRNPPRVLLSVDKPLTAQIVPGINFPAIPIPQAAELEPYQRARTLPWYWDLSAETGAEKEALYRARQERLSAAVCKTDNPPKQSAAAVKKAIKRAKTPKPAADIGLGELLFQCRKGSIYISQAEARFLVLPVKTTDELEHSLRALGFSFFRDRNVFRHSLKKSGQEAVRRAVTLLGGELD